MKAPSRKAIPSSAVAANLPPGASWVDAAVLKYGWLSPSGEAIDTGALDHEDVIEYMGLTYDGALLAGWLRVAGFVNYELDSTSEDAVRNLNARLKRLYYEGNLEDGRGDSMKVYLDTFDGKKGIDVRTSYVFEKKHFRRECFDVANIMAERRYEVH